jgi:hypothetical protein
MADSGTNLLMVGGGEGSDMVTAKFEHTDLLDSGMARWDVSVARKDIADLSLLQEVAGVVAQVRRSPMTTIKATIKGDRVPEIGSFALGDACTIVIKDARNPAGLIKPTRLIEWELHPPSSEHVEEASLLFEGDEPS